MMIAKIALVVILFIFYSASIGIMIKVCAAEERMERRLKQAKLAAGHRAKGGNP